TVHVPAGRPTAGQPPFSWEDSAIDALKLFRVTDLDSQDLASVLSAIERVNGLGYQKRGVSSPYLWGFTSGYTGGTFTADGVFDPRSQSKQIGAVALLRRLHDRGIVKLDSTVEVGAAGSPR